MKNQKVVLWGRSMGAVCAVLYQAQYPHASHLVLDSPFHNIEELMAVKFNELTSFPTFFAKKGVSIAKPSMNDILSFDISAFELEKSISKVKCGVTFLYNPLDEVSNKSTPLLYQHCRFNKEIFYTEVAHIECREPEVITSICIALMSRLQARKKSDLLKKFIKIRDISFEA